jgi:hypothetical protein
MLDGTVSRPFVEAMNAILIQDGIIAYIGTKSEFGQYKSTELGMTGPKTSERFWTSLPEHTLHAILGLSVSTTTSGRRKLVFYGSPRALMLGYMVSSYRVLSWEKILSDHLNSQKPFCLEVEMLKVAGMWQDLPIYPHELQTSLVDFVGWKSSKGLSIDRSETVALLNDARIDQMADQD